MVSTTEWFLHLNAFYTEWFLHLNGFYIWMFLQLNSFYTWMVSTHEWFLHLNDSTPEWLLHLNISTSERFIRLNGFYIWMVSTPEWFIHPNGFYIWMFLHLDVSTSEWFLCFFIRTVSDCQQAVPCRSWTDCQQAVPVVPEQTVSRQCRSFLNRLSAGSAGRSWTDLQQNINCSTMKLRGEESFLISYQLLSSQKLTTIFFRRNIYYRVHNITSLIPVLSQINPICALPS